MEYKQFQVEFLLHNTGTTAKDLDAEIATIDAMYATSSNEGGLLHDDLTKTKHYLEDVDTFGGLRVIEPPSWTRYQNGEYVTYRTGTVTIEAAIPRFLNPFRIIEWKESLEVQPAGNVYGMLQPNFGNATRQLIRQNQFFRATQQGRITYAAIKGPIPGPIYATGQVRPVKYRRSDPRKIGGDIDVAAYIGYPLDYTYEYEWHVDIGVLGVDA